MLPARLSIHNLIFSFHGFLSRLLLVYRRADGGIHKEGLLNASLHFSTGTVEHPDSGNTRVPGADPPPPGHIPTHSTPPPQLPVLLN